MELVGQLKPLLRVTLLVNGVGDLLLAANPGNAGVELLRASAFKSYLARTDAAPAVVDFLCAAFAIHGALRIYASLNIDSKHGRAVGAMSWLGEWLLLFQLREYLDPIAQPLFTAPLFWGGALLLLAQTDGGAQKKRQ